MAIFIVSDLHLGHSKDFIYGARGFENVEDMNEAIIRKWNEESGLHNGCMESLRLPEVAEIMLNQIKGRRIDYDW